MPKKPVTATQTRSVTNTKLAVATAALIAAGGLAFAALPASYVNEQGVKCGVNSFSTIQSCGRGQFSLVQVGCHDGSTVRIGNGRSCATLSAYHSKAASACKNLCAPAPERCEDSDGGNNPNISGVVTTSRGVYFDSCDPFDRTSSTLREGWCVPNVNTFTQTDHQCEFGCRNGRCLEAPVVEIPLISIDVVSSTVGRIFPDNAESLSGTWAILTEQADAVITDVLFQLVTEAEELNLLDVRRAIAQIDRVELRSGNQVVGNSIPDASGLIRFDDIEINLVERRPVQLYLETTIRDIESAQQTQIPVQYALLATTIETENGDNVPDENIEMWGLDGTSLGEAPLAERVVNGHVFFRSIPTIMTLPLQSDQLLSGAQDIYRFSIRADQNGDIGWSGIRLELTGVCSTAESMNVGACMDERSVRLYDRERNMILTSTTISGGIMLIELRETETIRAGSFNDYTIEATLDGFRAGDILTVQIRNHGDGHAPATDQIRAIQNFADQFGNGPFIWSDYSGLFEGRREQQWFNGYSIPELPTQYQRLRMQN